MPKKFRTSINGYNKEEVNDFLGNITKEYENLLERLKQADEEKEQLKKENQEYKDIESSLRRALVLADETNRNMKKITKDESISIIEDARKNASRIINDALIRAEKIENDANTIKRNVILYKNRIKNILSEEMEMLDKYDDMNF